MALNLKRMVNAIFRYPQIYCSAGTTVGFSSFFVFVNRSSYYPAAFMFDLSFEPIAEIAVTVASIAMGVYHCGVSKLLGSQYAKRAERNTEQRAANESRNGGFSWIFSGMRWYFVHSADCKLSVFDSE